MHQPLHHPMDLDHLSAVMTGEVQLKKQKRKRKLNAENQKVVTTGAVLGKKLKLKPKRAEKIKANAPILHLVVLNHEDRN